MKETDDEDDDTGGSTDIDFAAGDHRRDWRDQPERSATPIVRGVRAMRVALSDYEKFQQQMFDQLDDLEQSDQQRMLVGFLKIGSRCGVDVVKEIKQGKSVDGVFDHVMEKTKRA